MGLLSNLASGINKVLEQGTFMFAHPIQAVSAGLSKEKTIAGETEKFFSQPVSKQLTQVAVSGVSTALVAVGTAKIAAAGVVATATKLIPATTKGKVIASIAAPVALGAVVSQPTKTLSAISQTPGALANVGSNVAGFIAEPSIEKAKEIATENPVIVGAIATAGLLAVGSKVIPAVATYTQTQAIQEQTSAIKGATGLVVESGKDKDVITIPAQQTNPIPQTAQTQVIKTGAVTSTRRKRKKAVIMPQNISQRVNVLVNNDNRHATKNYIKREVLIA